MAKINLILALMIYVSSNAEKIINQATEVYQAAAEVRYSDPQQYVSIINKFYASEMIRRRQCVENINQDKKSRVPSILLAMSNRENFVNTMVDWSWTFNPKNPPRGLPATIPFIPFWKQVELIDWVFERYTKGKRGMVEKSREMGLTWLFCELYKNEWRWVEGFVGGFGSNKLDNVDKRDSPGCIFEKLRFSIKSMPSWWMPKGFKWHIHDKIGNLYNPEKNSTIIGQGGKDIGRGDRAAIYMVDEKAHLETPEEADAALSKTTDCQMDVSSVCGMNHFGQKRHSGKVDVFIFDWRDNPMLNDEWHKQQAAELDPVVVAQEIDRNYYSSVEGLFIKFEWAQAAAELDLQRSNFKWAGLDVAAGGKDLSCLAIRHGPYVKYKQWNFDNGIDLMNETIEICNNEGVMGLHYDQIGVGYAVHSGIHRTERKMDFEYFGLEGSRAASDTDYPEFGRKGSEIFLNARAEWCYLLAKRFQKTWEHVNNIKEYPHDELISIPRDGELMAELCSTKKQYTPSGKIKAESKEEMIRRGVKSPNVHDSVVLCFLPKDGGYKHVLSRVRSEPFKIDWDKPSGECLHYGVVCQNDDMSVTGFFALWHEVQGKLFIYDDFVSASPEAGKLANLIVEKMKLKKMELTKLLGNEKMFAEGRNSAAKNINNALWDLTNSYQAVKIKEPLKYDLTGSLFVVTSLIHNNGLILRPKCVESARQLSTWRLDAGKVKETGIREGLLLLVSELNKKQSFKKIVEKMDYNLDATGKPMRRPEEKYVEVK